MTMQQTQTYVRPPQVQGGGGDPMGEGPSALQAQAATYGAIARKALEDCKQGLSADEALQRRRNRSGQ